MAKGKGKRKSSVPKDETKEERFIRVATPRVNKAIKFIKMLGFCSGSSYSYMPEQVNKMCKAIQSALDATYKKLSEEKPTTGEFTF